MAKRMRKVGPAGEADYSRLWDLLPDAMRDKAMGALEHAGPPRQSLAPGVQGPPALAAEGMLAKGGRGVGNLVKGGLRKAPIGTAVGLAQLAMLFKEPVAAYADDLGLNPFRAADRAAQLGGAMEGDRAARESDMRRRELEQLTQENMARIVSLEPEFGQQLLAGRRLPRGARVIGGQKRFDLLQQVAQRMAAGEFQSQQAPPPGGLGGQGAF